MEFLFGQKRSVVNWLEALLDKQLQDIFKYGGAELLIPSLSFWREGEIWSQGAAEWISTIAHGCQQYIIHGPIRSEVEVVDWIGDGSSYTLYIKFWC